MNFDRHGVTARLERRLRQHGYAKGDPEACARAVKDLAQHARVNERHIWAVLSDQDYADRYLLDALRIEEIEQPRRYREKA